MEVRSNKCGEGFLEGFADAIQTGSAVKLPRILRLANQGDLGGVWNVVG